MPRFDFVWHRAIADLWFLMTTGQWWRFFEWDDGTWTHVDTFRGD